MLSGWGQNFFIRRVSVVSPIHDVSSAEIPAAAALRAGDVDLLVDGPPCQPFSKSAYWVNGDTRRLDDPRARTLHEYMR